MLAKALQGATAAADKLYIESVFQTWLYTGNGSTQTITNGIDLSGKGGLVWLKSRNSATDSHFLVDTARGGSSRLNSNNTNAANTNNAIVSFGSTGFSDTGYYGYASNLIASWTFRKAAKFFDVVTYTGNGTARTIAHNLGSVPGCIIVKSTSQADNWKVYHRSLTSNAYYILLDSTAAQSNAVDHWNNTTPTSTEFSISSSSNINTNGATYVAYLFAHDAGGFGDSGNDSVVKCGSYTGNGSTTGPVIDLGWEPQWLLIKNTTVASANNWIILDNMRGMPVGSNSARLVPNNSNAETVTVTDINPLPTGFQPATSNTTVNELNGTYIYIAIRRGPMKTPTDATKVFAAIAATASTGTSRSIGFPSDLIWARRRDASVTPQAVDRLRGLGTSSSSTTQPTFDMAVNTNAESTGGFATVYDVWNDTAKDGSYFNGQSTIWHHFRRAPGFFDVVAYAGGGFINESISHNLGVKPELVIIKRRNASELWWVNAVFGASTFQQGSLNTTDQFTATTYSAQGFGNPTSSALVFNSIGSSGHASGGTYIAYLFATCSGISKVGSYTGTGTTQQINCGFTAGARFVLIKRTDSTGDWYVWDTARGIISGNDPYLLLNSTAAEVTNTDYIDPLNSGFEISSTAPAAINANGGSFIFLAVA